MILVFVAPTIPAFAVTLVSAYVLVAFCVAIKESELAARFPSVSSWLSSTFASRAVWVAVETGSDATVQSLVALLAETSEKRIRSAESIVQFVIPVGKITSVDIL